MMLSFLLLLTLITKSSSVSVDGLSDELRSIHHEIGSLKDENYKQNMEIASLKETVQLQNKTISQHEITIKQLITDNRRIIKSDHPVSLAAQSRRKRPVRLLPVSILFGKKKNETDQQNVKLFYGPPTNCSDLTRLGYTLNGYYLVKNSVLSDDFKKTTKLEYVYCAFKQEGTHNPLLVQEEVISPLSSPSTLPSSSSFSSHPPKLDQEIFKTTHSSVVFNSTALNKEAKQSSCILLWRLKVGEPVGIHCLEHMKTFGDRPLLGRCSHPTAEQKWSMIESENAGMRICQEQWNQCLTFSSGRRYSPSFPHVSLKERDEKSKGQLFKMNNETSQLMIVESGSCLVGLFGSHRSIPAVGVHGCNETTDDITFKKWSVVPLNNCF